MTEVELQKLVAKVRARHTRRSLLALIVIIYVFGGLSIVPHSSPHRDFYIVCIGISACVLFVLIVMFMVRRSRADCSELGARCPACGFDLFSPLFGIRKIGETGVCPRCFHYLYDDVVA
jgi:hypothetical protein